MGEKAARKEWGKSGGKGEGKDGKETRGEKGGKEKMKSGKFG